MRPPAPAPEPETRCDEALRAVRPALLLCLTLVLGLAAPPAFGELYRWVDDQGRVHFSNTPRRGATRTAAEDSARFRNGGFQVDGGIPYAGASPSRFVELHTPVALDIQGSASGKRIVGRKKAGSSCSRDLGAIEVDTRAIVAGPALRDMVRRFTQVATTLGYRADGGPARPASVAPQARSGPGRDRVVVAATIQEIRLDVCAQTLSRTSGKLYTRSSAVMVVRWDLMGVAGGSAIETFETHGAYRDSSIRRQENVLDALSRAFGAAVAELFKDERFVGFLDPTDDELTRLAQASRAELTDRVVPPLPIRYGGGLGFLKSFDFDQLRRATVTVKRKEGHGSGFLLAGRRWVLTNWHVVAGAGDELEVEFDDGHSLAAEVVRGDPDRDVALLRLGRDAKVDSLELATARPRVGEVIYVIGTPLDPSLRQTVTRGIVSGHRQHEGLDFFQTDAAVNPGNSGGPAFNERGEVVGIAVAGVYSRAGGSMNINYLIPIDDALGKMALKARQGAR